MFRHTCFVLILNLFLLSPVFSQDGNIGGVYKIEYDSINSKGQKSVSTASAVAFEKTSTVTKFLTAGHLFFEKGSANYKVIVGDKQYDVTKYSELKNKDVSDTLVELHTENIEEVQCYNFSDEEIKIGDTVEMRGFPLGRFGQQKARVVELSFHEDVFYTAPPLPTVGYSGGAVLCDGYLIAIISGFMHKEQRGVMINTATFYKTIYPEE